MKVSLALSSRHACTLLPAYLPAPKPAAAKHRQSSGAITKDAPDPNKVKPASSDLLVDCNSGNVSARSTIIIGATEVVAPTAARAFCDWSRPSPAGTGAAVAVL